MNDAGYLVFLITNQAGVAHGYYTEEAVGALHGWMQVALRDDIRYCPFHPEGELAAYRQHSDWRKPGTGMIDDLIRHWDVDLKRSHLVGDQIKDMEAAPKVGLRSHLFQGGNLLRYLKSEGIG